MRLRVLIQCKMLGKSSLSLKLLSRPFVTGFASVISKQKYCLNLKKSISNGLSSDVRPFIFGIETSCDDTGCAIVNGKGEILADTLHSQQLVHLRNGGIIPPVAQQIHRSMMEPVATETFAKAGITETDIDAIAVTTRPGLQLSLCVGLKYAKHLARKFSKPIIDIHHMEAHALMARMEHQVDFPFLVLLISGGHCLLALVNDVNDFNLLGKSMDDAPGEAFDKAARRIKLRNIDDFSTLCGGQAIEKAAMLAENPYSFEFPMQMMNYRNCDFAFGGLKNNFRKFLLKKEKEHNIEGDGVIPEAYDLCAGFLYSMTKHICQRTQRAMEYLEYKQLIPENNKTLVVSGGVACNNFITGGLNVVCNELGYRLVRPRSKLCTDNGIMIAWNGVEKYKKNIDIHTNLSPIDIQSKCPLGEDIRKSVETADIKCSWVKLKKLFDKPHTTLKLNTITSS